MDRMINAPFFSPVAEDSRANSIPVSPDRWEHKCQEQKSNSMLNKSNWNLKRFWFFQLKFECIFFKSVSREKLTQDERMSFIKRNELIQFKFS